MQSVLGKIICIVVLGAGLSGCATMGVYDSEPQCGSGNSYNGRCVSTSKAHELAVKGLDGAEHDEEWLKKHDKKPSRQGEEARRQLEPTADGATEYTEYKKGVYKRLGSLLKEQNAPISTPGMAVRVLLLPYKGGDGGNTLYMQRWAYVRIEDPRWVIGDSLVELEGDDDY